MQNLYTQGIQIMWYDIPLVHVQWGVISGDIKVKCTPLYFEERHPKVSPVFWDDRASIKDLRKFMESRTVPPTRFDLKDVLKKYGLIDYDPFKMVKISHGVSMTDHIWVLFDDEPRLSYTQVRVRS